MTPETDPSAEPAAPIRLTLAPEEPEAGCDVTLTATIDPEALPGATDLLILDAEGNELARADLIETGERLESEPVTLAAPLQAGEHRWQALLVAVPEGDGEDEAPEPVAVAFTVPVRAHPVSVVVWGAPPVLSCGEGFAVHVGLKCPCGCDASGWRFTLRDESGRVLHEGQVGAEPWGGTEGLRHAELALTAPAEEGTATWTVHADPPEHEATHAGGTAALRIVTRPAPEVTITVVVTEAATGAPVPRAKVVVHPYRALADGNGIATLRVPKGFYTVQVSGGKYFAARTEGEVDGDVTITAELEIDREFSDADAWA